MRFAIFLVLFTAAALAIAQDDISPGKKTPSVTLAPVTTAAVTRGKPTSVELKFTIGSGFHINSHTPKSEFLIPTNLKLEAPPQVAVVKVAFPAGEDQTFPFSPDEKLNVYSGDFSVAVTLRAAASQQPGTYPVKGTLRYQACDNAACYPPKNLPVEFQVEVGKK